MKVAGALAALALVLPSPALAACVSDADARVLVTAVVPQTLGHLGELCSASLPSDAALLDRSSTRWNTLVAAADEATTAAVPIALTFASGGFFGTSDPEEALPFVAVLFTGLIGQGAGERACGRIDEVWSLLAPLPPAAFAELFALTLRDAPGVICREETE